MKSVDVLLTFAIVAALAAISPPAISFYYGETGPMTATLNTAIALAAH